MRVFCPHSRFPVFPISGEIQNVLIMGQGKLYFSPGKVEVRISMDPDVPAGACGRRPHSSSFFTCSLLIIAALPVSLCASTGSEGIVTVRHMADLVLQLGIILIVSRLSGTVSERFHLPRALGELGAGIIIGPFLLGGISLPGFPGGVFPLNSEFLPVSEPLYGIATLASVILLFYAGLETDLALFLKFSMAGIVTGIGGVVVSFFTGSFICSLLTHLPVSDPICLFMGIICTATSVGITVRMLSEKGAMDTPEGVTIISAAVIDDIIGIILLTIVIGFLSMVRSGSGGNSGNIWNIVFISVRAVGVWFVFTFVGLKFSSQLAAQLKRFHSLTVLAVMAAALAFICAAIFEKAGLALIIGAYVMGLTLSVTDIRRVIEERLRPIYFFVVPVFFTVMGMMVNMGNLMSKRILVLGTIYTAGAIAAKCIGCGVPALFANFNILGATRIGLGMVPRSEVALIIAGIGLSHGMMTQEFFGVTIFMTMVTTLFAPVVLNHFLSKPGRGTKKEVVVHKKVTCAFDFNGPELTGLVEDRALDVFREEGFFVQRHESEVNRYFIQRENISIAMKVSKQGIELETDEDNMAYARTIFYETVVDLYTTINKVRKTLHPEQLKKQLASPSKGPKGGSGLSAQHLRDASVTMDLASVTKEDVLRELLEPLRRRNKLRDFQKVLDAVMERESSMSTGMQYGIALPHARTDAVPDVAVSIGFKRDGIDFGALDGKPSTIFICILMPAESHGPHVHLLAAVAGKLDTPQKAQQLLLCKTREEVIRFFFS
jgi:Kef-type K+ transport system membrane component KefB/mannitol/fructose-specific phosphotransferase system IIA component (Ntr-type)